MNILSLRTTASSKNKECTCGSIWCHECLYKKMRTLIGASEIQIKWHEKKDKWLITILDENGERASFESVVEPILRF